MLETEPELFSFHSFVLINPYIFSVEYNISPENDPEGILEDYSR